MSLGESRAKEPKLELGTIPNPSSAINKIPLKKKPKVLEAMGFIIHIPIYKDLIAEGVTFVGLGGIIY